MAKKVKIIITIQAPAGKANPAPPIGPALGQHGVNIMDFVNKFNDQTRELGDTIIPAEITVYEDRTFTFVTKLPPVSEMIRQKLKIKKGSGKPNTEFVGELSRDQVSAIATEKLPDLNTTNLESAINTVMGTARSMGVKIKA